MKILGVCLLIGMMGLAFLTSYDAACAAEKNITIAQMKGAVEVKMAGSDTWTPAKWSMRLGAGDTIRTKTNSYVDLNFDGMGQTAIVRVEQNSTMEIDTFATGRILARKKILLDLAIGEVLVKASKLKGKSQFQVRTPNSLVGVRGTGFKVRVSAAE